MKYTFKSTLFLFVFFALNLSAYSQLAIESVSSAESAVRDVLMYNTDGKGIESVSNFEWSGGVSVGKFTNSYIGGVGSNGIVLSTGDVSNIPGQPSDLASSAGSGYTDSELKDLLYEGNTVVEVFDIAYLKFDFVPISDTVYLKLAFASEEYPEFVDSTFFDRFGIFVKGETPKYIDENTIERIDSSSNIATVPGSNANLQIDQVYNISPTKLSHAKYYIDSDSNYYINNMVFNGMIATKNVKNGIHLAPDFIQVAIPVNPCSTEPYTMLIVIADAKDSLYDSAIFIEEGSFETNHRQNEIEEITVDLKRDVVICPEIGDTATLYNKAEGGWGHYRYYWYKGGESGEFSLDSTYLVNSLDATTTMYVEAIDICDVSNFSNTVELKLQCPIKIPNVFTPNGDGYNDKFEVENIDQYVDVSMVIYNRHGKKIFETSHYENQDQWWDGGDYASGAYFYVLEFKIDGEEKKSKGLITILRN